MPILKIKNSQTTVDVALLSVIDGGIRLPPSMKIWDHARALHTLSTEGRITATIVAGSATNVSDKDGPRIVAGQRGNNSLAIAVPRVTVLVPS